MRLFRVTFSKGSRKFKLRASAVILLMGIGVLSGLFIAEIVVRKIIYLPLNEEYMRFRSLPEMRIPEGTGDVDLFWKSSSEFANSKHGFEKEPGTFRVICIGDSVTQSHGVDRMPLRKEETFVYKLETLLNKRNGRFKFDLINAGVGGYSSLQGLRYLERRLIKYNPDLVISWFGINDESRAMFFPDKDQIFSGVINKPKKSFLEHSQLYLLLKNEVFSEKYRRVSPDDFYANCEKMRLLSEKYNFKIVFVIPFKVEKNIVRNLPEYTEALERLRQKHHCELFDVGKALGRYPEADKLFIDGVHATAEGNAVIAEIIFQMIEDGEFILESE